MLFSVNANAQLATEDFEGGIPTDWSIVGNANAVSTWNTTTDGYLNSNAVEVDPSLDNVGDGITAEYYLVTPLFTTPENGEIRFFTKQGSAADEGTEYQVKISTADQPDINGFNIVLDSWTESELNSGSQTEYEEKVVEIPEGIAAGIDIYIAFVAVNTQSGAAPTGDSWFVDNVRVIEGCTDVLEENVTVSDVSAVSATANWSHDTATNFEVQVVESGITPAATGTEVSETSYTFNNLSAETEYDIYIKTLCDNDTSSGFAGPFSFTTGIEGTTCETAIEVPDVFNSGNYVLEDNLSNYFNEDIEYDTQGTGCLSQSTNYLNGDQAFLTYTASESGLITINQSVLGYAPGEGDGNCFNSNTAVLIYNSCSDVGVGCLDALSTSSSNLEAQISNFYVESGETYIIVISSELQPEAGICFTLEIEGSSCAAPAPSAVTYGGLTQTSVEFSWNNPGGLADSWEYAVVSTGDGEPTTGITSTSTNLDNPVTGLTAETTYDLYIRSTCDTSTGNWGDPYTFTTQCDIFSTPYFEDFNEGTNSNPVPCWYVIDANNDGETWGYLGGNPSLRLNSVDDESDDYFISPTIDVSGAQKRLRFKYRTYNGVGDVPLEILVSDTGVSVDDFDTALVPEQVFNTDGDYLEMIVVIPTSITGNVNFAWHVPPNAGEDATRIYLNDVYVEDQPACPNPISPMVDGVTTTTVDVSWTQGYEETQWEVFVQEQGGEAPTDADSGELADSNPYTVSDLEPATQYEYYVRAYCNDSEQSEWVGPINFFTDCNAYDLPFYESFNDTDPDTQKYCWEILDNNSDNFTYTINAESTVIQGGFFGSPPSDEYLISPAINMDGTKLLKFKYRAFYNIIQGSANSNLTILMSTTDTDPSSFTELEPLFNITNTEDLEKEIYVNANGPVYFAFYIANVGTGVNIDDVEIIDAPDCPSPTELLVDNVGLDTAELAWQTGFQETEWNVSVQPEGSGAPSITGSATSTNYIVSDLAPDTIYEAYVQAACEGGESEWIGPVSFRTLCTAFDTPFFEGFEADSESEGCWRIFNENDDQHTWNTTSLIYPFEGNESAGMFTGSNGNNLDYLVSPTITITEGQRLRYYYKVNDSFFTEDLEVLLSTNGIELSEFTTVLYDSDDDPVILNNEEYKEKVINFPAGVSGEVNIAFHVPYFPSTGTYRGQSLFIDNFIIEDIPNCPKPSNISLTNITDTEVEVSWETNGGETDWEIAVLPYEEDVPIGDVADEYLYETGTNPYTVTGLDPSTKYEIYVRAVCGDDINSEWLGVGELTTQCSFENLCNYTFVLTSDTSLSSELILTQNNQAVQTLPFNGEDSEEFNVLLCSGIEFSLYFDTVGSHAPQYANYQFDILDEEDNVVYSSPTGLTPLTTVYTGVSTCGDLACPQPTDLSINENMEFSWTPVGDETEWEVSIQPIGNGTLPQSGTIVSTTSYTPDAADFIDQNTATYEYFVRAICGEGEESYWSGPFEFVRNDDSSTELILPINETNSCVNSVTDVSFRNASVSGETISCDVTNQADIWFNFEAISEVHIIEANGFTGNFYYTSGEEPYPDMTMTLYKVNEDESLTEVKCSRSNVIVASYSSELVIGDSYKVRLTLNSPELSTRMFSLCATTPEDLCTFNAVNYDFEQPPLNQFSGVTSISTPLVIPGWRQNMETDEANAVFLWESLNAPGFDAYSGAQCIQLISDDASLYDEDSPRGLFKDFDSSEITAFDYSFATRGRSEGNTIQLFAGPPEGPYTLIAEESSVGAWTVYTGTYQVPGGQEQTRFLFRAKDYGIGNLLDAANFIPNNRIETDDFMIDCSMQSIDVEANGLGVWESSEDNPGPVLISDSESNEITISDFTVPGNYTFYWRTRYCEDEIVVEYEGISEVPIIDSPVEYCLDEPTVALSATAQGDFDLLWFTEEVGGEGSATAPTPDASSVGETSYYVSHVDSNGCKGPRVEIVVVVNDVTDPVVEFSYAETCINAANNPLPDLVEDFFEGGTFSSTGLSVDPVTGEIDLSSATFGAYEVTYEVEEDLENCILASSYTADVILNPSTPVVTDFAYSNTVYCSNSEEVLPELGEDFSLEGEFSSSEGLSLDSSTGAIDFNSSAVGDYTIIYTVEEDLSICQQGSSSSFALSIEASSSIEILEECSDNDLVLIANPIEAGVNASSLSYQWQTSSGDLVGNNSEEFNVSDYLAQNSSLSLPMSFIVVVGDNVCSTEAGITVESISCGEIPRGISPNGDGKNDSFDLSNLGVRSISIYNRYGREVYSKSNYTNEWYGQSSNQNELPDGTYYYSLQKNDGQVVTGWVYVNREY
ncbi:choice-of-anchor J domain-containing protein [Mesonia aquimarina]|uniref:choice-of-anchor J domain-containing protein n=1 Tax=Mesonia aquimarina TaxID=1504967 RepID=UPI000EF61A06|nr:choice-of-anchor J domain-containing protein [Mesonia aquimarina]